MEGDGAPSDVHPHQLRIAHKSRTNVTQMLPYPSKDLEDYGQLYENVTVALKDVFVFVEDVVSLS